MSEQIVIAIMLTVMGLSLAGVMAARAAHSKKVRIKSKSGN